MWSLSAGKVESPESTHDSIEYLPLCLYKQRKQQLLGAPLHVAQPNALCMHIKLLPIWISNTIYGLSQTLELSAPHNNNFLKLTRMLGFYSRSPTLLNINDDKFKPPTTPHPNPY
jgi:hypothetical protein